MFKGSFPCCTRAAWNGNRAVFLDEFSTATAFADARKRFDDEPTCQLGRRNVFGLGHVVKWRDQRIIEPERVVFGSCHVSSPVEFNPA